MGVKLKNILKTAYDVYPIFNRPMAVCAVMCIAAILYLFNHVSVSYSIFLLFLIILAAVCAVTRSFKAVMISVLFLAVCASALNEFFKIDELNRLDGQTVQTVFAAVEDSTDTEKVSKVTVYAAGDKTIPANTKFVLYWFDGKKIRCGDKFKATVKLTSLKDDEYKSYNYGNSVYMNSRLIEIDESYKPNALFSEIGKVRNYIVSTLDSRFPKSVSSILIALNTGDRDYLSPEFYEDVLVCGVSHVMVVSGLHISIILGLLFGLIERVFYNRYLKAVCSLGILFLIAAMCGFTQSVLRAALMFVFFVLAPVFMRRNDPLNSLGAAVVLMLFISPLCIFSVAFLLSVTSTAAVVWIAPFYTELITRRLFIKNRFAVSTVSVFTVSVSAMIFTAPVSMSVFNTVSLLSPVTFLLITFPVTFALEFNTSALLFSAIPGVRVLSVPLFFISGLCARYIRFIVEKLGLLDFMLIKADIYQFLISLFLIFALINGMYLCKFYRKMLKRNQLKEVRQHGGNVRGGVEKKPSKRAD